MVETSPHLVHLFSTFALGDAQLRTARLIAGLGLRYRHTIVALDRRTAARGVIPPDLDVGVVGPPPGANRWLALRRLLGLLKPDLVIACARSGPRAALVGVSAAPLVLRLEGEPEDVMPRVPRPLLRRLLGRVAAIVAWQAPDQDALRLDGPPIEVIPDGVVVEPRPKSRPVPDLNKRAGEVAIAAMLPPRGPHHLIEILHAFRQAPHHRVAHLVLLGQGADRPALVREARRLDIAGRVQVVGEPGDPAELLAGFDLFAPASAAGRPPLMALEAMAAGLPLIGTGGAALRELVAVQNREFVLDPDQGPALAARLDALLRSTQLRRQLGHANRDRAGDFPFERMIEAWAGLIARVLERNVGANSAGSL